jgi:CRISPR-associated protein Cas1
MVNAFVYCPRLAYLEWVQQEFEDSVDTVEGRGLHRRVDAPPESNVEPSDEGGHRSVLLGSERLGVIARIDLVEIDGDSAVPVDFKHGRPPENGPYESETVQLCLAAMLLEEHGWHVPYGVISYPESRTRIVVEITPDLRNHAVEAVAALKELASSGVIPPPLVDSPKCPRCSLVGICLPDEVNLLRSEEAERVRPLAVRREPAMPVIVTEQGARLGKEGGVLKVTKQGEVLGEVPLRRVSHVCLYGNVSVSAQALRELAGLQRPVFHFTYGGWLTAITTGLPHRNVELRIRQYQAFIDEQRSLRLARLFTEGKIRNCRNLLRRNADPRDDRTIDLLANHAVRARQAETVDELRGVEGAAAALYFGDFGRMIRVQHLGDFDWTSRNRRPPRDPVNALLSFMYSLLLRDALAATLTVGFDPHLGFFHRPRYGRPSLALDLAEEFRPLVADSTVIRMINNGEVAATDFVTRLGACSLTTAGRKKAIAAYERRISQEIHHPVFGYRASYRRILELQARLLGRHLLGECVYKPFVTR